MTTKQTATLEAPGATLVYDVRPGDGTGDPTPLVLVGSPQGAEGFTSLAARLPGRTLVTYDPRSERSTVHPGTAPATPATHVADIRRVVAASAGITGHTGPVDVFATSGGALNALAWISEHPGEVRTLVAHEPPVAHYLPDRDLMIAAMADVADTYQAKGLGAGMAKFIALVMHQGELPADYLDRPAPDPAQFGLPAQDDGSRDDPLLGVGMRATPRFVPDDDALRAAAASGRVILAQGEESAQEMPGRSAAAAAARLGLPLAVFPGSHNGFMGGEYGQPAGKPEEFAAKLREVLAG
ncbi:alpha/beta hydrolase [Myceligenerans crystallogenes]|uniref:Alpha/beta hydrolase n=1 Tax=Myceligenerans crystallogenes TaxID=316335 RepID=A0ABN2N6J7_9MICO